MAENDSGLNPTRSNSEVLRDLANTFSDEAQDNAKQRMISSNFRLDRGEVPFDETLINLSQARDAIISGVDSGAIVQLPLRIQKNLIQASRNVSLQLTSMSNGTDAVIPFVSAVDEFMEALWNSNLQNMSGEILGFHEKLNQLKTLEKRLKELDQRAKLFEDAEGRASQNLQTLGQLVTTAESIRSDLTQRLEVAKSDLSKIDEAKAASLAAVAAAQQNEKSSAEVASAARLASGDLESLRTKAGQTVSYLDEAKTNYDSLAEERRLKEGYAFKSNISISLEPYRELVERLVNKSDPVEAGKYLDFVLSSIDKVFTSPTQRVIQERSTEGDVATVKETSQGISKVIGSVADMVQSLAKLK